MLGYEGDAGGLADLVSVLLDSIIECGRAGILNLMFEGDFAEEALLDDEPLRDIKLLLYSELALLVFWCVEVECKKFFSSVLEGPDFVGLNADSDVDLEFEISSCDLPFFNFDLIDSLEDLELLSLLALF